MPIGNNPPLVVRSEIGTEPLRHGARRTAIGGHRIQTDEVNVRVIERVILRRPGRNAARFAVGGQREASEVRKGGGSGVGFGSIVIAYSRPYGRVAKQRC